MPMGRFAIAVVREDCPNVLDGIAHNLPRAGHRFRHVQNLGIFQEVEGRFTAFLHDVQIGGHLWGFLRQTQHSPRERFIRI